MEIAARITRNKSLRKVQNHRSSYRAKALRISVKPSNCGVDKMLEILSPKISKKIVTTITTTSILSTQTTGRTSLNEQTRQTKLTETQDIPIESMITLFKGNS